MARTTFAVALTNASKFWVLLDHLEHVEERNEGLVGGLDEKELEGVTVECDALEGAEDRVKDGATSHYSSQHCQSHSR